MADTTTKTKIVKSRSGCIACKKKRMKCDEALPNCQNCIRRKIECPGYVKPLKWSGKHEKFRPQRTAQSTPAKQDATGLPISGGTAHDVYERPNAGIGTARGDLPSEDAHSGGDNAAANNTTVYEPEGADLASETNDDHGGALFVYPVEDAFDQSGVDWMLDGQHSSQAVPGLDDIIEEMTAEDMLVPEADFPLTAFSSSFADDGDEHAEQLISHYFQTACRVMSCFDSPSNPYRTDVPQASTMFPHLYHCMMSMTAAHMANFSGEMALANLDHQAKAVNTLQEEMAKLAVHDSPPAEISMTRYQILLGTIMLGMTSAWHDPSAYTLSHLQGARHLFRAWSAELELVNASGEAVILDREQSFIVGSMAYWEVLASFLTDQPLDALDYLEPFCMVSHEQTIYPNSWTGVSSPTFIRLAQVGVLMRQKRVLQKLAFIKRGTGAEDPGLLDDARTLHAKIMDCHLPAREAMEPTGDPNTPLNHLCDVAKVYRFIALLELYQAFPALLVEQNNGSTSQRRTSMGGAQEGLVFDLATSALTILSELPKTSGVFTVLAIAYISAGSAIQPPLVGPKPGSGNGAGLEDELNSVRQSKAVVRWWRDHVREQIIHIHRQLGFASIQRGAKLVQEVWNRSDIQSDMSANSGMPATIHWMDVMIDQRLETLYG